VPVERQRLVLGGDENAPESRVDAVAEREVDDSVGSAEIHGRLGPLGRERVKPFARAACEQDYENVVQRHGRSSIIASPGAACATESQFLRAFSALRFD
jgi:hypothetical protein